MPQYIYDIDQNSPEWFDARICSIGGTGINKVAGGGKGRKDLLYEFAGELITGVPAESFKFRHADRGHEFEPDARDYYAFTRGIEVKQCGLVKADEPHKHVSPDGLVSDSGGLEIKTRIPSVFVKAFVEDTVDIAVRRQIQWSIWITERDWWDLVLYCPEMMSQGVEPIIKRVYRDEKPKSKRMEWVTGKKLNDAANEFIKEMNELANRIRRAA